MIDPRSCMHNSRSDTATPVQLPSELEIMSFEKVKNANEYMKDLELRRKI